MDLPRIVWMLWLQGIQAAPPLVQACVRSWTIANPGWDVRILDRGAVSAHVDVREHFPRSTQRAGRATVEADLIRVALLHEHGGVWADATVFCVTPLDEWLPPMMSSGFFAFDRPQPSRMLANWFLAARPGHPIMTAWNERVEEYWADREVSDDYFWHHACFAEAYQRDAAARQAWDATPKISADGPHFFYPYDERLLGPLDGTQRRRLLSQQDPVYKLTHKVNASRAEPRSAYAYFLNQVHLPQTPGPSEPLASTLARFRAAGGRILLHAGSPKSGSTSMQNALHDHRKLLLDHGICYAANISKATIDPKHQWIVFRLRTRDLDLLEEGFTQAVDEALETGATTLLLSTEGLYNHWTDYASWAGPWFRGLAELVPVELWLLLRDPVGFASALYQQILRNPRASPQPNGRAVPAAEMLHRQSFLSRVDYDAVVGWWEDILGPDRVRVDVYVSPMAPLVRDALGVPDLPWADRRDNASLSGVGCAMLLHLNAFAIPDEDRGRIIEHVAAIDALATSVLGHQPVLTTAEQRRVREIMRPSLLRLTSRRPELAPLLREESEPRLAAAPKGSVVAPRPALPYAIPTDSRLDPAAAVPVVLQKQLRRLRAAGGRLLLHGGAPKTGSTSMQHVFERQSDKLLRHGICYPSSTAQRRAPKHQWLSNALVLRSVDILATRLGAAIDEALQAEATTVLLSTEGLYTFWPQYEGWAGDWFRDIAAEVDVDVWFLLREPLSFAAGLYQEALRNRRIGAATKGQPWTPGRALSEPALLHRLDYDAVVSWWEDIVGSDRVRVDVYPDVLEPLVGAALGVPDLDWDAARANPSLTGYGCELLVHLNTLNLPEDLHDDVLAHVTEIDSIARAALGPRHILSEEEAAFVREYTRPSLERLISRRPELSPLLGGS